MLKRDSYFGCFLMITYVSRIAASCLQIISCPCGNKTEQVYYSQCVNEAYAKEACKQWANCETCKSYTSYCLTCAPGRSGHSCGDATNCSDPGSIQFGYRQLINGATSKVSNMYSSGQSFQYFCNNGYELQGNKVLTCLTSGLWSSKAPTCQNRATDAPTTFCMLPKLETTGMIIEPSIDINDRGQVFSPGTEMMFDCEYGYEMEGNDWIIYCQLNGEWTSEPPACKRSPELEGSTSSFCYHPGVIENGITEDENIEKTSEQKQVYLPGAELRYLCIDGFEVIGPSVILCTLDGEWSDDPPKCRKTRVTTATSTRRVCPNPSVVPNGLLLEDIPSNDPRRRSQGFEAGSQVRFTCKNGYELNGSNPITCLRNGQWTSDAPTCIRTSRSSGILCPDPGIVENGGTVVYYQYPNVLPSQFQDNFDSLVYPVGTKLRYDCTEGYRLEGEKDIICSEIGIWSGVKPRCFEDCGRSMLGAGGKVTHGVTQTSGIFPWIVFIFMNETRNTCGGVLLDHQTVLTAAHCLENVENCTLYFGKDNRNDDEFVETRKCSELLKHPEFNVNTFDNDIAIVKFSPDISYSLRVQPICMPSPKTTVENVVPGQKGYISGWGLNQNQAETSRLVITNLPVQAYETCIAPYQKRNRAVNIPQGIFCAGSPEKTINACNGYSGLPLVFYNNKTERFVVEGLVSYGTSGRCDQPESYVMFTKVFNYLQWIYQNLQFKIR